jgi:hypothetical protein
MGTVYRALAEANRLGLPGYRLMAAQDLGFSIGLQGRFAEGIALEEEAIALARDTGIRLYETAARRYLARLALLGGDPIRAEQESRSVLDEPAVPHQRACAFAVLSAGSPPELPRARARERAPPLARGRMARALTRLAPGRDRAS